jgi:hypothetical protein
MQGAHGLIIQYFDTFVLSDGDFSGHMLYTIFKFIIFNKESYLYILISFK